MQNQKSLKKGNRLIAEFMGLTYRNGIYYDLDDGHAVVYEKDLEYHSSWDWIMPVIEKIEQLKYEAVFQLNTYNTSLRWLLNYHEEGAIYSCHKGAYMISKDRIRESKIQAVWSLLVEFIKWYNKQKK